MATIAAAAGTFVVSCSTCDVHARGQYELVVLTAREHERTTSCTVQVSDRRADGTLAPLPRYMWEGVHRGPTDVEIHEWLAGATS